MIPEALERDGSVTADQSVHSWVVGWHDHEEDRLKLCVEATPDECGGLFMREMLEKHYGELQKRGKDRPRDSMKAKQLMAVISGCAVCFSLDHQGCPQGFCPNGTRMKRFDTAMLDDLERRMLNSK